jgi:hypothetical protein
MNSKYIYYLFLPAMALWFGCSKKIDVNAPTLNITITNGTHIANDTISFKLGDTTKFAFSGYAGNVSVYTGDGGHNYAYKDRTFASGIPQLSFSSLEQYGTQTNTLQVLATDSLAVLDSAHVVNARWTDITSRAVLSTGATSAVASGTITLSDLVKNAKDSLFIAFKYIGATGSTQRTWTITNYTVNNVLPDATQSISSLATDNAYWTKFKIGTSTASWASTTSQLQVVGGAATAPNNISWIVSKPLYVGRVAPDLAVGLKNIGTADLTTYNYKYAAVGTYTVTFLIFNNSVDAQQTVIKQFNIKVTN